MEPRMMYQLANTPLPEGVEVKFVPSYGELYAYDRGFYLLTREESKAFHSQIIRDIKDKINADEDLTAEKIQDMSVHDMMQLSVQAVEIERHLQVKPVDEILKTPIGYIDKLKKDRLDQFYQRMHYLHSTINSKDPWSPPDLV
jgi:hypothetical protein